MSWELLTLLGLPSDESAMLQYYVLSDDDLKHIKRKQRPSNRLGFALQLCALRYLGRYLSKGDIIPKEMIEFVDAQLELTEKHVSDFTYKKENIIPLVRVYKARMF